MPHMVVLGAWHMPLKQQPEGQVVPSQPAHAPLEQRPAPHI
jgi:hypothetical protein